MWAGEGGQIVWYVQQGTRCVEARSREMENWGKLHVAVWAWRLSLVDKCMLGTQPMRRMPNVCEILGGWTVHAVGERN
jgi:hypothetical protein